MICLIPYWMDFVFLYTIIHVINLLFNDVICIYLSVSFYSIAFIANRYELYRHADCPLLVNKTEICEICNSVEKLASKDLLIKRLRIPYVPF